MCFTGQIKHILDMFQFYMGVFKLAFSCGKTMSGEPGSQKDWNYHGKPPGIKAKKGHFFFGDEWWASITSLTFGRSAFFGGKPPWYWGIFGRGWAPLILGVY